MNHPGQITIDQSRSSGTKSECRLERGLTTGNIVTRRLALATLGLFLSLGVVACGGGGAEVRSEVTTTTKGQQFLDLKKAFEAGALSKDEYERERKRILEKE